MKHRAIASLRPVACSPPAGDRLLRVCELSVRACAWFSSWSTSIPSLIWGSLVIRDGPIEGGQDNTVVTDRVHGVHYWLMSIFYQISDASPRFF